MTTIRRIAQAVLLAVSATLCACGGGGGGAGQPLPDPRISLQMSTHAIQSGDTVTATWETQHLDRCTASGAWSGSRTLSGTEVLGPFPVTTRQTLSFTLACTRGSGASYSASKFVVVEPLPVPPVGYSYSASHNDVKDIAWEPRGGLLYLITGSEAAVHPNSLIALDPVSGNIAGSAFAGSEPASLALSSDAQYAYVGMARANRVQRFRLSGLTADLDIPVDPDVRAQADSPEPLFARGLSVSPMSPHTIVVARRNPQISDDTAGAMVFDHAVPRRNAFSLGYYLHELEWSPDGSRLFGLDWLHERQQLSILSVSPDLVQLTDAVEGLNARRLDALQLNSGLIFTDSGSVFDPVASRFLGRLPISGEPGVVAPDMPNNRIFVAQQGNDTGTMVITSYDASSLAPIGSALLGPAQGSFVRGDPSRILRWGDRGLAICSGGQLIVFWGDFVKAVPGAATPVGTIPGTEPGEIVPLDLAIATQLLPFKANDIAWDTQRSLIYASVPASASAPQGAIAIVDPVTLAVLSTIPTAAEPGPIAVSAASKYLYVGEQDAFQRFTLPGATAKLTVNLTRNGLKRLAPAPESAETVALSFNGAESQVFVGGTALTGAFPGGDAVWGANDRQIFTIGNEGSGFNFYSYGLEGGEAIPQGTASKKFSYITNFPFYMRTWFSQGRIIAETGTVYDPASRAILGTLPLDRAGGGQQPRAYILVDDSHRLAFASINASHRLSVQPPNEFAIFDLEKFTTIERVRLPREVSGLARRMLRTAQARFVVLSAEGDIVVVDAPSLAE